MDTYDGPIANLEEKKEKKGREVKKEHTIAAEAIRAMGVPAAKVKAVALDISRGEDWM